MGHAPTKVAPTDTPILDVLAERWSTRVYDDAAPLDEAALASALEAARWSPSASNSQPWRFVVARRGSETFDKIVATLTGLNTEWAPRAAALVIFLTEGPLEPTKPWSVYDTGQASAHFTVQAHAGGLYTHQMAGFDRGALRESLALPDDVTPIAAMAVGALGDLDDVSEKIRERELTPRVRKPLSETILIND